MGLPNKLLLAGSAIAELCNLHYDNSEVNNTANNLTDLHTYTLPANVLTKNGSQIQFEYYGAFVAATDSRLILSVGGAEIFDTGLIAPAGGGFCVKGRVVRTAPGAQVYGVFMVSVGQSFSTSAAGLTLDETLPLDFILQGFHANADKVEALFSNLAFVAGP